MWTRFALLSITIAAHITATPFGTVNPILPLNQHDEHEHITRAALRCKTSEPLNKDCFEPTSLNQLAGRTGYFGAVGAPDRLAQLTNFDSSEGPEAHCDDADFFNSVNGSSYPQSREAATAQLSKCVQHLQQQMAQAAQAGRLMLQDTHLIKSEVDLSLLQPVCEIDYTKRDPRSKCRAILGFGRVLHGVQDFYSHSNWADLAIGPFSPANPPGLGRTDPAQFLDLRSAASPNISPDMNDLSTGCYAGFGHDKIPGQNNPGKSEFPDCTNRVSHRALNKDAGNIGDDGTTSGVTSNPPRGQLIVDGQTNFDRAVQMAIKDTKRQWLYLRDAIRKEYEAQQANLIICALTRDDPVKSCQGRKIAIVIDSSGSNQETDPSNLRIAAAQSFNNMLTTAANAGDDGKPDFVTVIDFDDSARVIYPLGDPASAKFDGIDSEGGTSIASGLQLAIDELTKDTTDSVANRAGIVLLTDGQDPSLFPLLEQKARAELLGIRLSIGFLSVPAVPGGLIPRSAHLAKRDDPPLELVRAILDTGGTYGIISSAEAQQNFVDLVFANGVTAIDDGGGATILYPGLTVSSLLANADESKSFTYEAKAGEQLMFTVTALTNIVLKATMHDILGNQDIQTQITNSTEKMEFDIGVSADYWLELVVSSATGMNLTTSGVFTVGLTSRRRGSDSNPYSNGTISWNNSTHGALSHSSSVPNFPNQTFSTSGPGGAYSATLHPQSSVYSSFGYTSGGLSVDPLSPTSIVVYPIPVTKTFLGTTTCETIYSTSTFTYPTTVTGPCRGRCPEESTAIADGSSLQTSDAVDDSPDLSSNDMPEEAVSSPEITNDPDVAPQQDTTHPKTTSTITPQDISETFAPSQPLHVSTAAILLSAETSDSVATSTFNMDQHTSEIILPPIAQFTGGATSVMGHATTIWLGVCIGTVVSIWTTLAVVY